MSSEGTDLVMYKTRLEKHASGMKCEVFIQSKGFGPRSRFCVNIFIYKINAVVAQSVMPHNSDLTYFVEKLLTCL